MYCTECGVKCQSLGDGEYQCLNEQCKARFVYDGEMAAYFLRNPGEPFPSETGEPAVNFG